MWRSFVAADQGPQGPEHRAASSPGSSELDPGRRALLCRLAPALRGVGGGEPPLAGLIGLDRVALHHPHGQRHRNRTHDAAPHLALACADEHPPRPDLCEDLPRRAGALRTQGARARHGFRRRLGRHLGPRGLRAVAGGPLEPLGAKRRSRGPPTPTAASGQRWPVAGAEHREWRGESGALALRWRPPAAAGTVAALFPGRGEPGLRVLCAEGSPSPSGATRGAAGLRGR
mmetsp:Transcript_58199/g.189687  ORF Transcript_58199/g.189687 Transcript_58199/m.189687 type:complete len:230 (+) Transcript_58199:1125-1814(+)